MDVTGSVVTDPVIVYGANSAYILPALVSIYSLQKNASRPVDVTLYLEAEDLEPHDLDLVDKARNRLGLRLEHKLFDDAVFQGYEELNSRFPVITLLPLVLPGMVEGRCLFLDADTLVNGDVCELLDMDMQGKSLGAVPGLMTSERMHSTALNIRVSDLLRPARSRRRRSAVIHRMISLGYFPARESYFNSGVLLMDCHVIREQFSDWQSLGDVEWLAPFAELPDQDRLNQFFRDRWFRLPSKWNTPTGIRRYLRHHIFRDASESLKLQMLEAAENPMVWHFLGRKKPWKGSGMTRFLRLRRQAFRDYARTLAEFEAYIGISPQAVVEEDRFRD